MSNIYVSAEVYAKEGKMDELGKVLQDVIAPVRAEEGCIRYDLLRSKDRNMFLFYEIWESMPHLEAHWETPHINGLREKTEPFVSEPAKVELWTEEDVAS